MYDEERPYEVVRPASDSSTRQGYWDMGAGLQAVDGLRPSPYAESQASRYVAGDLSAAELSREIERHYDDSSEGQEREADTVAARITALLDSSPQTRFDLSGRQLCIIHGTLFRGVLPKPWVGTYRTQDITKAEPILGGRSVMYSPAVEIAMAVDYDMQQERSHPAYDVRTREGLAHFASFVAGIWQIHPFREGNTRTTAVFSQLYLRKLGVQTDNEPFRENSLYYRDALVRASVTAPDESAPDLSFIKAFYDAVINGRPFDSHVDMNVHGIRQDDDLPYRQAKEYGDESGGQGE